MDSVVRLSLEKLNAPQRAYAIVRKTQSVEAASLLARFCLQSQDFGVGITLCLICYEHRRRQVAECRGHVDMFYVMYRNYMGNVGAGIDC